jgi:hypothetical protein
MKDSEHLSRFKRRVDSRNFNVVEIDDTPKLRRGEFGNIRFKGEVSVEFDGKIFKGDRVEEFTLEDKWFVIRIK